MKPSSPAHRAVRGITLVELLVASSVTAIILTSLCGVYFAIAQDWERQQGASSALAASSQACAKLSDYISQGVSVYVLTRYTTGDTLVVNLPLDTTAGGLYVPVWSGGSVKYRSGSWMVFYLSDSTGSYSQRGDILWAASASSYPFTAVTADQAWSMYYGTGKGRITPLSSLAFAADSSGARPAVTITATSGYKIRSTSAKVVVSRTVCLKNSN